MCVYVGEQPADDLGDTEEDGEGISSTSKRDWGPVPECKGSLLWGRSPWKVL